MEPLKLKLFVSPCYLLIRSNTDEYNCCTLDVKQANWDLNRRNTFFIIHASNSSSSDILLASIFFPTSGSPLLLFLHSCCLKIFFLINSCVQYIEYRPLSKPIKDLWIKNMWFGDHRYRFCCKFKHCCYLMFWDSIYCVSLPVLELTT